MVWKLRKAPKRELYWVVNKETGKKHSKEPLEKEQALAQMRALYASERKVGGVSAKVKEETIDRMLSIRTPTELNATTDITAMDRAVWWEVHPHELDTRPKRLQARAKAMFDWFMASPENVEIMPSAPPSLKIKPMQPLPRKKPDYTINQLREVTNTYNRSGESHTATFNTDNRGKIFTEWRTDTDSLRSVINHRITELFTSAYMYNPYYYIQSRKVKIDGETGEETQIGVIDTMYGKASFNEYKKKTPASKELIGSGITIPKADFIKEHERLIRILQQGTKAERALEAKDQSEELRKQGGASTHMNYLQQMADSAYPGKTLQQIGSYDLVFQTPTLKFYKDDKNIIVAIRGTTEANDWQANSLAIVGKLKSSNRYKTDLRTLLEFQSKYPKSKYHYVGVAHSLGAAILDGFIRAGLLRMGMSYNGLAEPQELRGNPLHHRIYHNKDPLYLAFGRYMPNIEVRGGTSSFFDKFTHNLPFGLSDLFTMYDRHRLKTFQGGGYRC